MQMKFKLKGGFNDGESTKVNVFSSVTMFIGCPIKPKLALNSVLGRRGSRQGRTRRMPPLFWALKQRRRKKDGKKRERWKSEEYKLGTHRPIASLLVVFDIFKVW